MQELELEVQQLMAKAEAADSKPLQEGLSIPEEITRREERKAQLQKAREVIEERARQRAQAQQPEYEKKMADRQAKRQMIALQQLPELIRRVGELERKAKRPPAKPQE